MAKENYIIDPMSIQLPDHGLGKFVEGYTSKGDSFNWKNIFWNLIPIFGQLVFLAKWGITLYNNSRVKNILIYQNGFVTQLTNKKGELKKEDVYNYHTLKGMSLQKTRNFSRVYGITNYTGTSVSLNVMEKDGCVMNIFDGTYYNKEDYPEDHDFLGYSVHAINNSWINFSIDNFNREFSEKGYATFYSDYQTIILGKGYIKVNDKGVSGQFKYAFDNGILYLYPPEEGNFNSKPNPITVNIAKMYNKEIFLMAINKLLGIR